MNRRDAVLGLLSLAAAPAASFAQSEGRIWRVGFLAPRHVVFADSDYYYGPFRLRMRELGYVEGRNLVIEWRSAEGKNERLAALAAELVNRKVDVIVAASTPAASAAQKSTSEIQIVMFGIGDPVRSGFVKSLARPEGNITGLSNMAGDLRVKQIDVLLGLAPNLSRLAVLMNPSNRAHIGALEAIEAAASTRNVKIVRADARSSQEIDDAFSSMRRQNADALLVSPDSFFQQQMKQIILLAASHRLPAIYTFPTVAEAGGLVSYGPSLAEQVRGAATFVDKILKGVKPADLAVEQPTVFELVLNLKTARALGLKVPQSVLIRADRVLE